MSGLSQPNKHVGLTSFPDKLSESQRLRVIIEIVLQILSRYHEILRE